MEPFLGQIMMFGGNFAPRGWAFCNGQLLAISTYQALFSILGTTYGGDGRTTFALPDLRGRVPINSGGFSAGPGLTPRRLGQRAGEETHTLNILEMPNHNHFASGTVKASTVEGTTNNPSTNVFATGKTPLDRSTTLDSNVYNQTPNTNMAPNGVTVEVGYSGGNQSHNNMQPYLAINFVIALEGIYPSRS